MPTMQSAITTVLIVAAASLLIRVAIAYYPTEMSPYV